MASTGDISNDTRGWILCVISAVACVAGACIVCVDVFIRLLPGKKNFNIQDSSAFLSSSMSLSFGVMIFSSLFSMLPSSKRYLIRDGHSDQIAGLLMMGSFAVGFLGMQVVSRIIHRFMPSHVVDCDHSHEEEADAADPEHDAHDDSYFHTHNHAGGSARRARSRPYSRPSSSGADAGASEATPLLNPTAGGQLGMRRQLSSRSFRSARSDGTPAAAVVAAAVGANDVSLAQRPLHGKRSLSSLRRPSMIEIQNRVLSFVKDVKSNCDESGPCFGYTDPCGQECKRTVVARTPSSLHTAFSSSIRPHEHGADAGLLHPEWETNIPVVPEEGGSHVGTLQGTHPETPETPGAVVAGTVRRYLHDPQDHEEMQEGDPETSCPPSGGESSTNVSNYGAVENVKADHHVHSHVHGHGHGHNHSHNHNHVHAAEHGDVDIENGALDYAHQQQPQHHHHVPANAFLSIGLQTVLAIGLHKFPEGFITFATNHANPALGFNVFMALFVHNIAEGFAMALPLYMALGSRFKAIMWSAALGGLSQPVGAGFAALWLQYLGRNDGKKGDKGNADDLGTAYGVLFAVTAGIMVAVALQLFVESLTLHHNRQLTIGFAFVGMMMLGLSNAIGAH
ncbi:zip zinc transporter [Ophiostoma piceae UAMH 11346]|uniref:Zip zinc transporter n=1 Tax=Ophiostoma piceae (strain UAMH 11346) TaxID=1262450 RepID=S3CB30_OPHP1|nr:zip zinc transporter [Ophiostoma piceae UAMH 11346]